MTIDASIVDRDAPYRDAELPIEERVEDLLARMLPEEKVAQLGSAWMFELVQRRRGRRRPRLPRSAGTASGRSRASPERAR